MLPNWKRTFTAQGPRDQIQTLVVRVKACLAMSQSPGARQGEQAKSFPLDGPGWHEVRPYNNGADFQDHDQVHDRR